MKAITGKYSVSFNMSIGEYEVGEADMCSIDYAGDDIDLLAAEAIKDDPDYPMTFERIESAQIVGVFHGKDNHVCGIMFA